MKPAVKDFVLLVLASPIYCLKWLAQTVRGWPYWQVSYTPQIRCHNCGGDISLVGIWRCQCRYTYRGHLLRECPVCGASPRMVRCYRCGVTRKLPER